MSSRLAIVQGAVLGLILCAVWYLVWVKPSDQKVMRTLDRMEQTKTDRGE